MLSFLSVSFVSFFVVVLDLVDLGSCGCFGALSRFSPAHRSSRGVVQGDRPTLEPAEIDAVEAPAMPPIGHNSMLQHGYSRQNCCRCWRCLPDSGCLPNESAGTEDKPDCLHDSVPADSSGAAAARACCLCCLADAAGAADAVDAGVSSMLVVFADSSPAAAWCCPADAGPVGRPGGRAALEHDREVPGVRQLPGTALILVAHGRAALLHSQSLFLLVSRLRPVRLSSASRSLAKYRRS